MYNKSNKSNSNTKMKRKRGFKKEKVHLIFDEKERTEYLTGFRKRNLARKVKRKEDLDKLLKEEKKKIKQNQKEALHNAILSQRQVPEIQHLLEPVTYDLPDHTVTISQITDVDSIHALSSIDIDAPVPAAGKSQDEVEKLRRVIKDLKTKRIKTLQKSTVQFKAKNAQKKLNKQKAKRMRQIFQKGLKNTKKKHKKKHVK